MAERRCLNCESPIAAAARFCPHCSQRTDTARLSFADMARDLMHAFVNVERGPLMFAWALLTRPGRIAHEYVEGRRQPGPGARWRSWLKGVLVAAVGHALIVGIVIGATSSLHMMGPDHGG